MRAAEHPAAGLHPVPDDLASAVLARGGHRMDRALEGVERVRLPFALDRNGLVVLVAANLTSRHGGRATRPGPRSLHATEARVRPLAASHLRHRAAVDAHDVGG